MQSCLWSKSFDLYSKSNIIYDNHNVYDKSYEQCDIVVSKYQNILSGCDCETCGPGDLDLWGLMS